MNRKFDLAAPLTTRQQLADPHAGTPLSHQLEQSGAVDLRSNKHVVLQENGYATATPIDRNKRFGPKP